MRGTDTSNGEVSQRIRFIPACAGNSVLLSFFLLSQSVHPRVCGEQQAISVLSQVITGSSPRVRGTACWMAVACRFQRFIPACAGNRTHDDWTDPGTAVHPRVCGEQPDCQPLRCASTGSSPRVRGTDHDQEQDVERSRFIPACAGNSAAYRSYWGDAPVHPRVCGEQRCRSPERPKNSGSSPRVRGTGGSIWPERREVRFIPACAGNRQSGRLNDVALAVHPRVCGEQNHEGDVAIAANGSSPRVRGTDSSSSGICTSERFIPACAGNRLPPAAGEPAISVHPRVCGEQITITTELVKATGSSPRVRGTVFPRMILLPARRFIPACAGNRNQSPTQTRAESVHPRVCGEQNQISLCSIKSYGSSPRVRGTAC